MLLKPSMRLPLQKSTTFENSLEGHLTGITWKDPEGKQQASRSSYIELDFSSFTKQISEAHPTLDKAKKKAGLHVLWVFVQHPCALLMI